jgi:hypothetical protein
MKKMLFVPSPVSSCVACVWLTASRLVEDPEVAITGEYMRIKGCCSIERKIKKNAKTVCVNINKMLFVMIEPSPVGSCVAPVWLTASRLVEDPDFAITGEYMRIKRCCNIERKIKKNAKHKTQNAKRKTQNANRNAERKTQDAKRKTQNAKRKTQNAKRKTQNACMCLYVFVCVCVCVRVCGPIASRALAAFAPLW